MRKVRIFVSMLLVVNLLSVPQFAVMAAEVEATRIQVIDSKLLDAFEANGSSSKQSAWIILEDIDHAAPLSYKSEVDLQRTAQLDLTADTVEGSNQTEIEVIQKKIIEQREESRKLYNLQNGAFAEKYLAPDDVLFISQYSPVIIASLTQSQANQLALMHNVTSIDLYTPATLNISTTSVENTTIAPMADNASTNYLSMINAGASSWFTGQGIKLGIMDKALPLVSSWTELGLDSVKCHVSECSLNDYSILTSEESRSHATMTASLAKSVAPDAQLYSATCSCGLHAIEWLITQGVNIINSSRSIGFDGLNESTGKWTYNVYGPASKWVDHLAIYHNVTIVQAAGNFGGNGIVSGGMAYNAITVGNVIDLGMVHPFSSYNNMITSLATKPDLCAPGTNIYAADPTRFGTSLSAPLVSGAVALMCQQKAELLYQQETVKALLSAGVNRNYATYTTQSRSETNDYRRHGAGILDCGQNYRALRRSDYRNGYMATATRDTYTDYSVTWEKGITVRVALAYLQYTELSSSDHISASIRQGVLPNLDLEIYYNGSRVAYSENPTNNIEIVEYTTREYGTYTIRVRNKLSTDNHAYYSIAWSPG